MTSFGLLMMIVSNVLVIGLVAYCFYRVLKTPNADKHEHAPLGIDTRDRDVP